MARCSTRRPRTSPRAASRCSLSSARRARRARSSARGIDALLADQEKDGSWFGRWGMNYIYGTWSALCALAIAGQDPQSEPVRRAVAWLVRIQNPDGGWGESGDSYRLDYKGYEPAPSTASQTAWALLGLMAAGEADHPAVARGIAYLAATQGEDGFWNEPFHTATGFSARLLPALSRLFEVFSALGARPLSQPQARQQPGACLRHVKAPQAVARYADKKPNPRSYVA